MSSGYRIGDQKAMHFLTFTIVEWVDLFTRGIYRDIVLDSFRYCQANKGMQVHALVIMQLLQSRTLAHAKTTPGMARCHSPDRGGARGLWRAWAQGEDLP